MEFGHDALLLSNLADLVTELARLVFGEIAVSELVIDAPAQIPQAIVDLVATRMLTLPRSFGRTLDLTAERVLLLVQRPLLRTRDMAMIEFGHDALLLSDLPDLLAELAGLVFGEIAVSKLAIDALAQIPQAIVDLVPTRMLTLPRSFGRTLDLTAERVLLLVQRPLLLTRDMAMIGFGHDALFLSDLADLLAELARLAFGEIVVLELAIDALVQIPQAIVDLIATRMITLPIAAM
ncbi:MAG: hypothetical protein JOY90_21965 [Bradyrhizobium sp.]|uniref:hypothetical protein n=1 Tax=Bradyrhizobium sp. TaxID=376 RepID=UPI001D3B9274|nr:hypothetical protein [Bradyrhizobium sp.]MBV9563084.1 hypothetical protein [Bradyrhizobium sp.]